MLTIIVIRCLVIDDFELYLKGNFIKEFPSAAEVERQLNIPTQNVTSCCRGEYKYTHGYIFSYQSLL